MASIENLKANATELSESQNQSIDTKINNSQNDDEISNISSISSVRNHNSTDVSVYNNASDQDEVRHVNSCCDFKPKKKPKTAIERMRACRENLKANAAKLSEARKKAAEYSRTYRKRKKNEKLAHSPNVAEEDTNPKHAENRKKVSYMQQYMKNYRERKKLSASAQKRRAEEKIAAEVESNNQSINPEIDNSQNDDDEKLNISNISNVDNQNNTNVPVYNYASDQDERSDSDKAEKRKRNKKKPNVLTLKERILAIKAYYRKPIYSKIAKKFKCSWEEIKSIIQERNDILEHYEMATAHSTTLSVDELIARRQKLTFLGACMYEYIQRAQYHENATLEDNILLAQANEFSYILRIKSFIATKSWLRQFKISYSIPLTAKKIKMTRTPHVSLQPTKIITFCKRVMELNNKYPPRIKDEKSENLKAENTSNLVKIKTKAVASKTEADTPVESRARQKRRLKINLLEKALYEFIQRAQYHRKMLLNEDLHIKVACELNDILKIESFTPNKNWIKHFKLHFNINTSQRMIVVNRIPPASLDLKDILNYCSEMYSKTANHENLEIEEENTEDQQKSQPKKILNSRVQPETIVTLQFHNVDEVDIKPDINDIEFQILEDDEEVEQTNLKIQANKSMHLEKSTSEQSANSMGHCSDVEDIKPDITDIEFELVEDDEEVEQSALKIQHIKSMHVERNISEQLANGTDHCSDKEDIKPDMSDIEFMLVGDDQVVEQSGLKILQAKSMHVDKNSMEQAVISSGHLTGEEDTKTDMSDIEFMLVGDDEVVEQPGLKILQAKSMHVEKNEPEQSAISSDHSSGEEDTKTDMSDIEFMLVGDDEEVDQPASKIRKIEAAHHAENNSSEQSANSSGHGSHPRSDNQELSKRAKSKIHQTKEYATHSKGQSRDKNISRLEDRALVIAAYDSKMTFAKIAEEFNCQREDIKKIVRNRRSIMSSYKYYTSKVMVRRQKVTFLDQCMFEYTQRVKFHTNVYLNDNILINMATQLSEILKIKNFTVGKSWLDQFKATYNLSITQLQIVLKRNPPCSLNPRHIISYCRREQRNRRGQDPETLTTKPSSTDLMTTADDVKTIEDESSLLRQHKIETLETALYEYIQRSQYHRKMPLNEDLQIKVACELDNILKINNFVPNKGWLNHFKLHYNINTSQRMIVVNRIPPSSLDLKDILSYCCHTYRKKAQKSQNTLTGEHVDPLNEKEQGPDLQQEEQQPKQQIVIDLEVEPGTVVTTQANDPSEKDIKSGEKDIRTELSQQQEPLNSKSIKAKDLRYQGRIEFLEECMYEYIQRAQYHVNAYLDEANLSKKAAKFRDLLHIDNFLVSMSWLKQFKISYNIPLSQRQIVLKRTPPSSLNAREIISYCRQLRSNKGKICQDSEPITVDELQLRQHKLETLEKALFEYLQRLYNFQKISLKDSLQIRVACELENILKIDNFVPNKTWLNSFKLRYNTCTTQRNIDNRIPLNRKTRSSLDLNDILSYCGHTYRRNNQISSKIVTVEQEEEQQSHLQLEEQKPKQQIVIDLQPEMQPETEKEVSMEANDADEEDVKPLLPLLPIDLMEAYDADAEDVKPDVMDIKIELPQEQEQVQPLYSTSSEEEEEFQSTPLKIQNIDTLHMDDNSDDEVLPKLTKTYADALKKLKSLEEFSLLEENYRAIGFITQLENIFKNPPSKSN